MNKLYFHYYNTRHKKREENLLSASFSTKIPVVGAATAAIESRLGTRMKIAANWPFSLLQSRYVACP